MRFLPSSIRTLPRVLVGSLLVSVAAVDMARCATRRATACAKRARIRRHVLVACNVIKR